MTTEISRQSFLGDKAEVLFKELQIAVIGLGGGGSHIVQQLAHIGFSNLIICDYDRVDTEGTNLNRLVGGFRSDIENETLKTDIATRMAMNINPDINVKCHNKNWMDVADEIASCDIVFGCVDSYKQRESIEKHCRRYLIPYVDIGMIVSENDNRYNISGQIIASIPGGPCMKCMGFLSQENLAAEVAEYDKENIVQQVIWPNGLLASTAVGIVVNIISDWTKERKAFMYLVYDGNRMSLSEHPITAHLNQDCPHYPGEEIGPANKRAL